MLILVKTKLRLPKLRRLPSLKLKLVLKPRPLMLQNLQKKRKLLRLSLLLVKLPNKLMEIFLQNLLPQLFPKNPNGKSESETHSDCE